MSNTGLLNRQERSHKCLRQDYEINNKNHIMFKTGLQKREQRSRIV